MRWMVMLFAAACGGAPDQCDPCPGATIETTRLCGAPPYRVCKDGDADAPKTMFICSCDGGTRTISGWMTSDPTICGIYRGEWKATGCTN